MIEKVLSKCRCCNRGFSLIELMIVVAVVGILASIAYPSYRNHVLKSRRGDGTAALQEIAQRLEGFYGQNASYTDDLENDLDYVVDGDDYHVVGAEASYRARILPEDLAVCPLDTCYRIEAIPNGGQTDDLIQQFILWSTGRKEKKIGGAYSDGWEH